MPVLCPSSSKWYSREGKWLIAAYQEQKITADSEPVRN